MMVRSIMSCGISKQSEYIPLSCQQIKARSDARRLDPPRSANRVRSKMRQSSSQEQSSLLVEDAEFSEERLDLLSVATKGFSEIGCSGDPEKADRRITQSSHDFWTGALANSARIFAERDVTYVMGPILD